MLERSEISSAGAEEYVMADGSAFDDHADAIRRRSGCVESDNPIVALLYLLMRDRVPPGVIGGLVRQLKDNPGVKKFSNGWLALYAEDVFKELDVK